MENKIKYREEIQKNLAFIPEEYLEAIYKLVNLIAQPFIKKAEENKVTPEILQTYADKFLKGYSIFMKKDVGLNFSYQIQEKFTIFKLNLTSLAEQQREIIEEEFDLGKLCGEKEVKITFNEENQKYELESLIETENKEVDKKETERIMIADIKSNGIYFIETSEKDKWTPESANRDVGDLVAVMFKSVKSYKNKSEKQEETI